MYLSHFGLNESPFGITPNPAFFYAGSKRGDILEALIYAVTHGEGIIKVTGEVGSGKTMLCRMLESMLPKNIAVIFLVNPTLNREEVVFAIAGELGLATGGKRPDEVIRLLQSDLIAKHVAGKQVVLLIEEAQAMPLETLEEIRLFSNLETSHHKLLQIVLFGQPELDENLALPRMRQLKERITHSFTVPPLPLEVIPEFLMFRMRAAGYHGPDIFNKDAIKLIATVSEGIVRRISILADKALLAAFADNTHNIEIRHVKAAIRDSEFPDPSPRNQRKKLSFMSLALMNIVVLAGFGWKIFVVDTKNAQPDAIKPVVMAAIKEATPPVTIASTAATSSTITASSVTSSGIRTSTSTALAATTTTIRAPTTTTAIVADNAIRPSKKTVIATTAPPSSAVPAAAPAQLSASHESAALQERLDATKLWLANQPRAHLSLQITLMVADKLAPVELFLHKAQTEVGAGKIFVYRTRIGNTARFGVIYGSFATRAEAQATLVKISEQWGYRPQMRTIAGIQDEIKRSQNDNPGAQ